MNTKRTFTRACTFYNRTLVISTITTRRYRVLFLRATTLASTQVRPTLRSGLLHHLLTISVHGGLDLSRHVFYAAPGAIHKQLLACFSTRTTHYNEVTFRIPFGHRRVTSCLGLSHDTLSGRLYGVQSRNLLRFSGGHFILGRLPRWPGTPTKRN